MALVALQSLRAVLQKTMQPSHADTGGAMLKSKAIWSLRCIAAIGGPLALLIRAMRAVPHSYQGDALQVSGPFRSPLSLYAYLLAHFSSSSVVECY